VSDADTQQAPPPPPPPPSGSPFGRFLTSPVLLAGVLALVVGFAALRYIGDDGGGATAPVPSGIAGSWGTPPSGAAAQHIVQLEVARSGGTLTVDGCTGDLTPRETGADDEWVFSYADTSGERRCPRRMIVTVSLVDRSTLRVEGRRPGGREVFSGTLRRGA
jgi:hypothetical protein